MNKLTEDVADMLCTIITLGYFYKEKVNIQYLDNVATEKQTHDDILEKISKVVGKTMLASPMKEQNIMACIMAKNPKISSFGRAEEVAADFNRFISVLNTKANSLDSPPKGAYIGAMSTISSLFVLGPSDLKQYAPAYRDVSDEIRGSYEKAVEATNTAIKCIRDGNYQNLVPKLNFQYLNKPIAEKYSGGLFKSYHGMINAMVLFSTNFDSNNVILEIAIGSNTNKVASCLPCSMFMAANGNPATSTHLGRGDNWNIPDSNNSIPKRKWAEAIIKYYDIGQRLYVEKLGQSATYNELMSIIRHYNKNKVPDIFLEALTFEKSFLNRLNKFLK